MRYAFGFSLLLYFAISSVFAGPNVRETRLIYPIYGSTGQELQNQMNIFGPASPDQQFHASTRWYVTWNYRYKFTDNLCQLTKLNIHLHVIYEYPHWMNYAASPKTLQNKWNRCLHDLKMHENGHGENGKKAAIAVEAALQKIPAQENCDLLKITINDTANQIIEKHLQDDHEYDLKTKHGRV